MGGKHPFNRTQPHHRRHRGVEVLAAWGVSMRRWFAWAGALCLCHFGANSNTQAQAPELPLAAPLARDVPFRDRMVGPYRLPPVPDPPPRSPQKRGLPWAEAIQGEGPVFVGIYRGVTHPFSLPPGCIAPGFCTYPWMANGPTGTLGLRFDIEIAIRGVNSDASTVEIEVTSAAIARVGALDHRGLDDGFPLALPWNSVGTVARPHAGRICRLGSGCRPHPAPAWTDLSGPVRAGSIR